MYLDALREITQREKSVLIFDEVMTGFRAGFRRSAGTVRNSARPDHVGKDHRRRACRWAPTAGRPRSWTWWRRWARCIRRARFREIRWPWPRAATLRYLRRPQEHIYTGLEKLSGELVEGVTAAAKDAGVPLCCNRVGSMFTWFFTDGPVTDWTSAAKSDTEAFGRFFRAMLDSGVYLPPSQFEAAFLSAAHTEEDVQQTIAAAKQAFAMVHA